MRLHLHEWGEPEAPPVVCLHGVTAHGARFRRLAEERLASRFRVLAPDLRGHGRSGREPPWGIATHVVAAMLGELAAWPPAPIAVPTLLVLGADESVVGPRQLDRCRRALGDALTVVTVPGGHVVLWDALPETSDAVAGFLAPA